MTTSDVLPAVVPLMNLVLSAIALGGISYILVRRWLNDRYISRLLILDAIAFSSVTVLLFGALFQANVIHTDLWIWTGTGGRVVVAAGIIALLLQKWDHIPLLDRQLSGPEEILRQARVEAVRILEKAATEAAAKLEADGVMLERISHEAARTADNTAQIAENTKRD